MCKVIATEIALVPIILLSVIELICNTYLVFISLFFLPCTDEPFKYNAALMESSAFTIIWSVADAIVFNPLGNHLLTNEAEARREADHINIPLLYFYRRVDRAYLQEQERHQLVMQGEEERHQLVMQGFVENLQIFPAQEPIDIVANQPPLSQEELISQGAEMIKEDLLKDVNRATLVSFIEQDPESKIFHFLLTKAVYIYAFGSKKNVAIPRFFKDDTIREISALRQAPQAAETLIKLQPSLKEEKLFGTQIADRPVMSIFEKLKRIAAEELQHDLFNKCLLRAYTEAVKE